MNLNELSLFCAWVKALFKMQFLRVYSKQCRGVMRLIIKELKITKSNLVWALPSIQFLIELNREHFHNCLSLILICNQQRLRSSKPH